MRTITALIILGGMLTACETAGLGGSRDPVDLRVDKIEASVEDVKEDIALLAEGQLDLERKLDELIRRVDKRSEGPSVVPLGRRGPRGYPGSDGRDGKDGEAGADGVDGKDGIDGYPQSKTAMVSVAGTTAKVTDIVRVESLCPTGNDVAVGGSCQLITPAEECVGAHVVSSGTFDNDSGANAGFGCTYNTVGDTSTCEVIAFADCIRLP